MQTKSIITAMALALALAAAWSAVSQAQEIPQPLLGNCCSCQGQIRFGAPGKLDQLQLGARFVPVAQINPFDQGFSITLSNLNGVLFSGVLLPGEITEKSSGRRWTFRNKAAKTSGGLYSVGVWEYPDGSFRARVVGYGDLSGATLAEMTTVIVIGASSFFDTSNWDPTSNGWKHRF